MSICYSTTGAGGGVEQINQGDRSMPSPGLQGKKPERGQESRFKLLEQGKELCDFQSRCLQFPFERAGGRKES
jgi:hypothetical protein